MLYYERNLITTSGFTLDRERQKIHYGKNDHTASILIDRNRCQNDRISLLIVAGEPTWSQLYPTHAGWIRRLDTSRSGFLHTALPAATAHNGNRFKGNTLELGHLEGDFTGSGNEATATVAAAVALALFIALVARASPPSTSNNSLRGNLHATSHQFLVGLLITPSFSCKIFGTWFTDFFWDAVSQFHSTRGLQPLSHLIPFSMCAFGSSFLRNLFYLIHRQGMVNR